MARQKRTNKSPKTTKAIGPAKNLADAYNAVLSDLEDRKLFEAYYVNRPDSPINEIKKRLLLSRTPVKILFAGQTKSGKTTELFRLVRELEGKYFTVYYSVFRDMEPADLKYQDLLLLAALKLSDEAIKQKVKVGKRMTKLLSDWFIQVSGEVFETKTKEKSKELSLGAKLKYLVVGLTAGFKTNATVRTEVRKRLEPQVGGIIEKIDMLAATIKNETGREPLLIIDDLEKVDRAVAEDIFYGHTQTLGRPNLRTIFLFPKSMTYTEKGRLVASQLSNPIHLLNIMTSDREGHPNDLSLDLLRQIVFKRMDDALFEPDAFEYLLETSNGVLSDLFSVLAGACITALSTDKSKISWQDVDEHFRRLTDQFRRAIKEECYPTLAQVYKEKEAENGDYLWDMLHILAVLEYRDKAGLFYEVHPAVVPVLQEKKLV
jgi:hypothetical protein